MEEMEGLKKVVNVVEEGSTRNREGLDRL